MPGTKTIWNKVTGEAVDMYDIDARDALKKHPDEWGPLPADTRKVRSRRNALTQPSSEFVTERAGPPGAEPPAEAVRKAGDDPAAAPEDLGQDGDDDLRAINGVGPSGEKALRDRGLTTYAQIAALTPEQMEEIDDAVNGKGRVVKGDWPGQARALLKARDGHGLITP